MAASATTRHTFRRPDGTRGRQRRRCDHDTRRPPGLRPPAARRRRDHDDGDAAALRDTVAAADAVVLGTPMYHGTFSAPLKNALDHCGPDEFGGKAVGLVSVAGGSFPRQALGHLRTVCRALDAWTFPLQVAVPNSSDAFVDDVIVEAALTARLQQLGTAVVEYAGVDQYPALAAADAQGDDAQVVGHSQD